MRTPLPTALAVFLLAGCAGEDRPRNVILLIGDGFGMNHLALALESGPLAMAGLAADGGIGYAVPTPFGALVTDSAAAASQMATGQPMLPGTLSVDVATGEPVETVMEWAARRGFATGLVSNMNLTHATPASFTVHSSSRYNPEPGLADQLFDDPPVDVLLGGGGRSMVPERSRVADHLPGVALDAESRRTDDRNLLEEAKADGYTVVANRVELRDAAGAAPLLGVFAGHHLPYVLDRSWDGLDDAIPSLAELTEAALASLAGVEPGFFLMVEGGRIDYGGHDNDAGAMLAEIRDFDAAVQVAGDFARQRGDTLVLVTADHGTGGFSFTYAVGDPAPVPDAVQWDYAGAFRGPALGDRRHLELVASARRSVTETLADLDQPYRADELADALEIATAVRLSADEAAELAAELNAEPPVVRDFAAFYADSYGISLALVARKLARHTHVTWSTGGHTNEPLPLIGYGPGADAVLGIHSNTRVHGIVRSALGGE